MRIHHRPPSFSRRQRGGAVIELALLLTLLVTIVAGIFEFGRVFWYYDALSKATRNAARTLSVSATASIALTGAAAAKAQVVDAASSAGLPGFTSANVLVKCLNSSMLQSDCVDGSAPYGVRVSITGYTVQMASSIPFVGDDAADYILTLSPAATMPYMK